MENFNFVRDCMQNKAFSFHGQMNDGTPYRIDSDGQKEVSLTIGGNDYLATCHPDDEFNVMTGINLVFERYCEDNDWRKNLKFGDTICAKAYNLEYKFIKYASQNKECVMVYDPRTNAVLTYNLCCFNCKGEYND